MTILLNLKPEMEARLIAQAAAKGVSVEQYLESWIETNLIPEIERSPSQTQTPQEWVNLLEAFSNNPALANVPLLSDEAISRESIYREREDSQL
ncbi:hypothetical protein [Chlorogloeopsis sp. ULAP02]|uniref:hypothetical protein n=1 Tax=Chlorogloeopsis sp. ULAP02 TaxID=3107926 RepID=UPI003136CF09